MVSRIGFENNKSVERRLRKENPKLGVIEDILHAQMYIMI